LTPALIKSTASTPRQVRGVLETYTVADLNVELARQRSAGHLRTQSQPQQGSEKAQQEAELRLEAIRNEARQQVMNDPEFIRRQQEHEREMEEGRREYSLTQIFASAVPNYGYPSG
jgi:hypothetical protein